MNGGSGEVAFHVVRGLSLVADLTGERASSIGPAVDCRWSPSLSGHASATVSQAETSPPFCAGLVGAAHGFDGLFPSSSGLLFGVAKARAILAGGWLDLTINRHIAIRAIQADYLRTQLPNGKGDEQNLLRLGAGIVLRVR
jgi:outer membrane immunogenic protein